MDKTPKKTRVNISIDQELHKKMQFYSKKMGINWSQMIEQSVWPLIALFDKVFAEIEKSGEKDITKIKMMFQKLIHNLTGQAYEAYSSIEKDLEEKEEKISTKAKSL